MPTLGAYVNTVSTETQFQFQLQVNPNLDLAICQIVLHIGIEMIRYSIYQIQNMSCNLSQLTTLLTN